MKTTHIAVVAEGTGNIFADLGLPDAAGELTKARLTLEIASILKERGLTQREAAAVLGIKQPHVSELARNRAGSFSIGRLIDFLTILGRDVEIVDHARPPGTRRDVHRLRLMSLLHFLLPHLW